MTNDDKIKTKRYLLAKVVNSNKDFIEINKDELYHYCKELIKAEKYTSDNIQEFIEECNIKLVVTRYSMRWIFDIKISPDTNNVIHMTKPWEYKIGEMMPIVINLKTFGYTKDIYGFFIPVEK